MSKRFLAAATVLAAMFLGACRDEMAIKPVALRTIVQSPDAKLGFHIFGANELGDPLGDDELARSSGISALMGRAGCNDVERLGVAKAAQADADFEMRAKFGCILKNALGHQTDWSSRGESPRLQLVLFFNGGLNSRRTATRAAADLYAGILKTRRYPVFMVWPTGLVQTYTDVVLRTRDADQVKPGDPLNWPTMPLQVVSDLLGGVASYPKTLETTIRYQQAGFEDELVTTSGRPWRAQPGQMVIENGWETRNVAYGEAVDKKVSLRPERQALWPLRPLTLTLDGVGSALWDNMVRRSRMTVHNAEEFAAPDPERVASARREASGGCEMGLKGDGARLNRCFPAGAGAFSRFFHWYAACADPSSVAPTSDSCPLTDLKSEDRALLKQGRITLIGHSMGALVINEIVAAYPRLPYSEIVFMAGADSVRSTSRSVTPLIERNKGCTRFYNLMLHPWNDANEASARGAAPRGSLLEYIDQYLGRPRTVDDRTVGKWTNVAATKHLFGRSAQQWMLFQIHDRGGSEHKNDEQDMLSHGSFKHEGFANESFWNQQNVKLAPPAQNCNQAFFSQRR